jgi:predicted metal-dependent phosphoesterase TrpH
MSHREELADYAASRGIVLLPGVEATIENRHVLLYNFDYWTRPPHSFYDLYQLKRDNPEMLVIAPHPFFPSQFCLQRRLLEHIELFDGIEYSHFYMKKMNFNRRASKLASSSHLPMVGTSDAHFLWHMGITYSYIEAKEKSVSAVVEAVREGRVEVATRPLPVVDILFRIRHYPSLKVRRLANRYGYRREILHLKSSVIGHQSTDKIPPFKPAAS